MNLQFRRAEPRDAPAVAGLVNGAYRPRPGSEGWTHESSLVAGNRVDGERVMADIRAACSAVLIGLSGDERVGCIHVERHRRDAHIGMLAVAPHLQNRGLGKQLLAHAEAYAAGWFSPTRYVVAVLAPRAELIAFYRRRGYCETGGVTGYPAHAGVGTPKYDGLEVILMEKRAGNTRSSSGGEE